MCCCCVDIFDQKCVTQETIGWRNLGGQERRDRDSNWEEVRSGREERVGGMKGKKRGARGPCAINGLKQKQEELK